MGDPHGSPGDSWIVNGMLLRDDIGQEKGSGCERRLLICVCIGMISSCRDERDEGACVNLPILFITRQWTGRRVHVLGQG